MSLNEEAFWAQLFMRQKKKKERREIISIIFYK